MTVELLRNGLNNLKRNKMTAVEWLYNQQMKHPLGDWDYFLEQAKEMEKQIMIF